MQIKNMNSNTYKKFINYISKICNKMSFVYRSSSHQTRENILITNLKKQINLKNINSTKSIEIISETFKNDFNIFNKEYFNNEEKTKRSMVFELRKLYFVHLFDNNNNNNSKRNPIASEIINLEKSKNTNFKFLNSKEEIEQLFEKYKNNSDLFIYEKEIVFPNPKKENEQNRKEILTSCLSQYLYDNLTKNWVSHHKEALFFSQKENHNKNYDTINYYFKLNSKLIDDLKTTQIIPNWQYPHTLDRKSVV